jgi:Ca-activated chloride channel family protein
VPAAFFLTSVALLLLALARPQLVLPVPTQLSTVMLAIDVSRSMDATDLRPTRLDAAKTAAKDFVGRLPAGTKVGVVAFSGSASTVVPPTADRTAVDRGIDRLTVANGTAIGDGLLVAIGEAPVRIGSIPIALPGTGRGPNGSAPAPAAPPATSRDAATPEVVVLLSDGVSNQGASTTDAASRAKDLGVRVYTVGVGTVGGVINYQGQQTRVDLDETALRQIAETTGGRYFNATSAGDLSAIYHDLSGQIGWETQKTEVTFLVGAAALLASLAAGALSLIYFQRLPWSAGPRGLQMQPGRTRAVGPAQGDCRSSWLRSSLADRRLTRQFRPSRSALRRPVRMR